VVGKVESTELELFSKVGGKFLGSLCLLSTFRKDGASIGVICMSKVLKDLQAQAAKLMPHEWCAASEVVFYVGTTRIVPPGFSWTLTLNIQEAEQARLALGSTLHIEMMWDDEW
jgi:hypothetical protein